MTTSQGGAGGADEHAPLKILLYSDDRAVRDEVRFALGTRPDPDLPPVEILEVATEPHVFRELDSGTVDVAILDGEAVPVGGMGICRQLKDEIFQAPPVLVLVGRAQDGWLATWSKADAVVAHPIDPMLVASSVAQLMRQRMATRRPVS